MEREEGRSSMLTQRLPTPVINGRTFCPVKSALDLCWYLKSVITSSAAPGVMVKVKTETRTLAACSVLESLRIQTFQSKIRDEFGRECVGCSFKASCASYKF